MGVVQLRILALPLLAILFGAGLTWAAAAPKKKAAARPSATKTSARPAARNSAARRTVSKGRATSSYARSRRGRSPQPVAARRYHGQQSPTQERYTEIQQALAARGFLQSEPNGTWDAASVDALKRFQEEQNLPPTGKITSLSLIALGLGPRRNPMTATAQPQTVP